MTPWRRFRCWLCEDEIIVAFARGALNAEQRERIAYGEGKLDAMKELQQTYLRGWHDGTNAAFDAVEAEARERAVEVGDVEKAKRRGVH